MHHIMLPADVDRNLCIVVVGCFCLVIITFVLNSEGTVSVDDCTKNS